MTIKKYACLFISLVMSGASYAAGYLQASTPVLDEACVESPISVCAQHGFKFGAQFIYVQPTGNTTFSNNENLEWAPGVRLEAAYLFGDGYDLNINWTYFGNSDSRATLILNSEDGSLTEKVKDRFNAVNVEFGRYVRYSSVFAQRFHIGAQYADIKRQTQRTVFGDVIDPIADRDFDQTFQGFGPRAGIDTEYQLADSNLSLTGNAAVALLVGDVKLTNNLTSVNVNQRGIIPVAEARVGAKYTFDIAYQQLALEAGYQWAGYYQTMRDVTLMEEDNYGYHGLYAGLSWRGDILT